MNKAKRHQIVDKMQEMMYHDKPYIVLDYANIVDAWSKSWSGFVESPQGLYNSLSKQGLISAHQTS